MRSQWSARLAATLFAIGWLARATAVHAVPSYSGSDACAECHDAEASSYAKTAHARAESDASLLAGHTGCESCHGPGSEHVAAAGDSTQPGFRTIRDLRKLSPDEASAVCQTCHRSGMQINWPVSEHARNHVACIQCHTIHGHPDQAGPLLKSAVNTLCLSCHKDKRGQLAKTAHMPLREGSMDCASCHNPHGGPGPHQLKTATANELCLGCHADKRGPFLWEHAPVRENCLNCHQPHGSNNAKVLAGKLPFLCQRCHIGTRHPSTLYDLPDLTSNRLFNRSCTNCHSQIHGSNHPSGKFFLR